MRKVIDWFINERLNIEEINDFALQFIEPKKVKFFDMIKERRPFYLLYKTDRKRKPYSVLYGYYCRTFGYNAEPYDCEWHNVTKVWYKKENRFYVPSYRPRFGKEEHKIKNAIIISNSLYEIRKIQKQMNSVNTF